MSETIMTTTSTAATAPITVAASSQQQQQLILPPPPLTFYPPPQPPRNSTSEQIASHKSKFLGSAPFGFILGILQLIIWAVYADKSCCKNGQLQIWLLVSGSIACFLGSFLSCLTFILVCCLKKDDNAMVPALFCVSCVTLLAGLFGMVWFVMGNVWVFGSEACPKECQKSGDTMYAFCYWIIVIQDIIYGCALLYPIVLCCCLCCLPKGYGKLETPSDAGDKL